MSSPLDALLESLQALPGIGARSAQRLAWHLLQNDREGAARLVRALDGALSSLRHCARCNGFTEGEVCPRCADPERDASVLCVVETPADLAVLEQTHGYRGHYYVLMGRISPLDGIGPRELALERLIARACDGQVRELILATNFTNEGEATAHWIARRLHAQPIRISRIARGVPVGGELEYTDPGTLAQAILERRTMQDAAC